MADIIDLNEVRKRLRQESERQDLERPRSPYVIAVGPGEVEACFGPGQPELVMSVAAARAVSRLLTIAARQAERLTMPYCEDCKKHCCYRWHVGKAYEGRHRGVLVRAVCEKICKSSVRLRAIDSGEIFYVRGVNISWPMAGPGEG